MKYPLVCFSYSKFQLSHKFLLTETQIPAQVLISTNSRLRKNSCKDNFKITNLYKSITG